MALTRIKAQQISDIDYKQAVRVITVATVTLTGGAPSTVDGVNLVAGDRILVAGQSTGSENGLYDVSVLGTGSNGTWTRTADGDVTGEIQAGMIIMVTEGTAYKDTQWKLTTNNPIIIGTTALVFEQNSAYAFGNIYANGTAVLANAVGGTVTLSAGDNIAITGNNTSKTITISASGGGGSGTAITNGTSNVNVVSSGGNVTVGIGGTSNIALFSTAGVDVTGRVSATGNVTSNSNVTVGAATFTTSNIAVQGWSYSGVSLSITATEATPNGIFFGNAGVSFYVVGTTNDRIFQYNMSTANMANTGVLFGNVLVQTQDTSPVDLYIDSTGANLYVIGSTNDTVFQYSLSTPWDITTATYASKSFSVATQETTPQGIWFRPDMTTMYVVGSGNDAVYQYTLSQAGNVASATYANKSFSVSSQDSGPIAINLSPDGTTMWILGQTTNQVYAYTLGTAWDVSTAAYTPGTSYGFRAQGETGATGLYVDTGNSRAWIVGTTNDTVYQYNTNNSALIQGNSVGTIGGLMIGGNAAVSQALQVGGTSGFESTATFDGTVVMGSTMSLVGTTTGVMLLGTSITTANANMFTSQTTGQMFVGGTTGTGQITIGQSVGNQTLNLHTGSVGSGNTKTINIGTGGASGSNTNVTIGSATSGATTTTLIYGTANIGNVISRGTVSATGNVDGGNLRTAGLISATGNVTGANILTGGLISATGAITGASLNISTGTANIGNITNSNANGVGNIGNSTVYFNTVFAKATSAQYADVAEKYVADRPYAPGTVLEIGGAAEVQETTAYASARIAGVVSTSPALLMNSTESDVNAVEIALLGRVPCRVTGTIHRGDLLTSSDRPGVATALQPADYRPGCVIGKALEAHATAGDGLIEVLVGRL